MQGKPGESPVRQKECRWGIAVNQCAELYYRYQGMLITMMRWLPRQRSSNLRS